MVPGRGSGSWQGPEADLPGHGLKLGDSQENLGGEVGVMGRADQRGTPRPWQRRSWGFNLICVFSRGVAYPICFCIDQSGRSVDSGSWGCSS